MRPDLEATPASKALKMEATGNTHMDTRVLEVAESLTRSNRASEAVEAV